MKTTFCLIQDKYKYICLDLGQARRCGRRGKTGVSALNTKKQTNENSVKQGSLVSRIAIFFYNSCAPHKEWMAHSRLFKGTPKPQG